MQRNDFRDSFDTFEGIVGDNPGAEIVAGGAENSAHSSMLALGRQEYDEACDFAGLDLAAARRAAGRLPRRVLFGLGMQLGGGCASGTLYTTRMLVTLIFFIAGSALGAWHLPWWSAQANLAVC